MGFLFHDVGRIFCRTVTLLFDLLIPALSPAVHPSCSGRLAFDSSVLAFFSGDGRSAYFRVTPPSVKTADLYSYIPAVVNFLGVSGWGTPCFFLRYQRVSALRVRFQRLSFEAPRQWMILKHVIFLLYGDGLKNLDEISNWFRWMLSGSKRN